MPIVSPISSKRLEDELNRPRLALVYGRDRRLPDTAELASLPAREDVSAVPGDAGSHVGGVVRSVLNTPVVNRSISPARHS